MDSGAQVSMQQSTVDRRVAKTRQALMSAFVELVLTRGYEGLTVEQISRKANVGRSTLYLHFTGKEDLLRHSMRNVSGRMAACVDGEVAPRHLASLLEHFREQRFVNGAFFRDPIRALWVRALAALIEPRLSAAQKTGGARALVPRRLLALMVAETQIALVTHWLDGRFALTPELVAATLIANTRALLAGERGD